MDEKNYDFPSIGGENLDALLRDSRSMLETPAPAPAEQPAAPADAPSTPKPAQPTSQTAVSAPQKSKKAPSPSAAPASDKKTNKAQSDWNTKAPVGAGWSLARIIIYSCSVLLAALLIAIGTWMAADDVLSLTGAEREVTVEIQENASLSSVASQLKEQGLIKYPLLFRLYGKLFHADTKIAAGSHTLSTAYDYRALVVGMMASGGSRETVTVTIPEGYTAARIFALLEESGVCAAQELTEAVGTVEYDFLSDTDPSDPNRLEGWLFPDTYEFYMDDDPENVLAKFLNNFETKFDSDMRESLEELNASLSARAAEKGADFTPLTLRDLVTVASMIEKEASVSAERTTVASVIYNRLTDPDYPLLQVDATVYYALGTWDRELTAEDLRTESPYNTYVAEGLPAGPICSPGLNCLKAALYPADSDYYFYALDTNGSHHFSHNMEEHNAFLESLE